MVIGDWENTARIVTCYRLDSLGLKPQWGARFSRPHQTGTKAHPAYCTAGTRSLSRRWSGWDVALTIPSPFNVAAEYRYSYTCTSPLCLLGMNKTPFYLFCCYQMHSISWKWLSLAADDRTKLKPHYEIYWLKHMQTAKHQTLHSHTLHSSQFFTIFVWSWPNHHTHHVKI